MGNKYMSKQHIEARFTFTSKYWGRKAFEKLCSLERIFVQPSMHECGEGARKPCKMTLLREWSEYDSSLPEGEKDTFSCTWAVFAPAWRIWSLLERLDAKKVPYETDFGLIVE